MSSRFEVRRDASATARHGTADTARVLTLWADDARAAEAWQSSLVAEGLKIESGQMPRGSGDGHLMFVSTGMATQLARLREQRQAAASTPLLVACKALRDLDQVLALEMGADEVIDTSVSPPVVAARLRALWRRWEAVAPAQVPQPRELRFGALCLSAPERRVTLCDRLLPLSEGEFEVLWLLASQAGRAVSRSDILLRVRGLQDQPLDRSIDSRVYRIRAKLGDGSEAAARIRTVRNYGYAFSPRDW